MSSKKQPEKGQGFEQQHLVQEIKTMMSATGRDANNPFEVARYLYSTEKYNELTNEYVQTILMPAVESARTVDFLETIRNLRQKS